MRFSTALFARRPHLSPHDPVPRAFDAHDHHHSRSRLGLRPSQAEQPQQHTTKREADIIAYYRGALLRAHAELRDSWALYEAAPDACYDTRHVRAARSALDCAIGDLFAACGGTKPNISHVLAAAEESDRRMAVLEHELTGEVRRFELLARDVSEDSDVAAADDALVELRSFRSNTSKALSDADVARLDVVQATLLKLLDRDVAPPRSRRLPPQPKPRALPPLPDDEFENVPQAPEPREFPPIPPPSQQNLTKLVQSAKLYKNEVERNRGASLVLSDKSASAESSTAGTGTGTASSYSAGARSSSINQRRGTNLRAGGQRSHSLRVPSLRNPSLRRPRNMSHPQPPERDSTLGQRPVDKRTRSFMRFRVQQQHEQGGAGVTSGPKRRPSSIIKLGKALSLRDSEMRESVASHSSQATTATATTTATHLAEDPLHTQLSMAMNSPQRSSVIEAGEGRPRTSSRKLDEFGSRRNSSFSLSVRSFMGLVRQSPKPEQATNEAARMRRDSSTFQRDSVSCVLDLKSDVYNLRDNDGWGTEGDRFSARQSMVENDRSRIPNGTSAVVEKKAVDEKTNVGLGSERRRLPNSLDLAEFAEENGRMHMGKKTKDSSLLNTKDMVEKKRERRTERRGRIQGKKDTPPSPPSPLITWDGRDSPPPSPPSPLLLEAKDKSTSGTTSSESSDLTVSSGEALPQGWVLPQAPTLRDCAEYARSQAAGDDESHLGGELGAGAESMGRLSVRRTSAASFSATLYASGGGGSGDMRSEAVSDAGVMLTCSRVVGDGRCLFRSVVRGRAAGRDEPIPKPHAEKKAADRLRGRTVAELRRHRGLLLRFYVIEDNFERYIERMSNPRTYAGEPELLMLAKLLKTPIAVYLLLNGAYRRIQLYGKQYPGDPIRLRYLNATHYDCLLAVNAN